MRCAFLLAFVWVLLGAATFRASAASAQEADAPTTPEAAGEAAVVAEEPDAPGRSTLVHNAALMDELMERSTMQTIREQKFAAAAGITGGMILVGLSAWRLIEDDPQNAYSRGLGVMFMTLGMADLTTGIYAATRVPHEKRRLERWRNARSAGITELELAHFEGELEASRELRQGERLLVRWNGLTHAIAGVLVLSFAPIPNGSSRSDRVSGYVVGGIFMATGFAAFAASFRDTPSEKAWSDYKARKMPMPGHQFSWRLAPAISRRGAGLSFGATF
jgi:hypothetical protein